MAAVKKEAAAPERSYATPDDATKVRELLAKMGMGQRQAARELEISERTMRYYCGGEKVPRVVMLALERLLDLHRRTAT
jgi:DNA-binding XRE family transcriptional regulator